MRTNKSKRQYHALLSECLPDSYIKRIETTDLTKEISISELSNQDIVALTESNYIPARFVSAGPHRKADWSASWKDSGVIHTQEFGLIPYYFQTSTHIRTQKGIYLVHDPFIEFTLLKAYTEAIFRTFVPSFSVDCIVEYGCGIGTNLETISKIFPDFLIFGADWADTAGDQVLARKINNFSDFFLVDFFNPSTFRAPRTEGRRFLAVTIASLEQTGTSFDPFMAFLIQSKNCAGGIHIEPIIELQNPFDALDKQSIDYCTKRNYLKGFLPWLLNVNNIEVFVKNFGLGSRYLSGYQLAVWRKK